MTYKHHNGLYGAEYEALKSADNASKLTERQWNIIEDIETNLRRWGGPDIVKVEQILSSNFWCPNTTEGHTGTGLIVSGLVKKELLPLIRINKSGKHAQTAKYLIKKEFVSVLPLKAQVRSKTKK